MKMLDHKKRSNLGLTEGYHRHAMTCLFDCIKVMLQKIESLVWE